MPSGRGLLPPIGCFYEPLAGRLIRGGGYWACGPGCFLKRFFCPPGRGFSWACGPGISAARALVLLGLRPGHFRCAAAAG